MSRVTIHLLYCNNGKHDWEREPKRGRTPNNCPEHPDEKKIYTPVNVDENGMRTLHCKIGNHEWKRPPQRGRTPDNCPDHPRIASNKIESTEATSAKGRSTKTAQEGSQSVRRGRPKKSPDDPSKRAREIVAHLEEGLKRNGTHISQQGTDKAKVHKIVKPATPSEETADAEAKPKPRTRSRKTTATNETTKPKTTRSRKTAATAK